MSSIPLSQPEIFEVELSPRYLPSRGDLVAWVASLGVHLVVIAILATIHFEVMQETERAITSEMDEEELEPLQYAFDAELTDQLGNDSNTDILSSSQDTAAKIGERDPLRAIQEQVDTPLAVPIPLVIDDIPKPEQAEFAAPIQTRGATEHPGGVEGAVDRLAWEIHNSLREGKTLVVWLFDVSPSLNKRRQVIADRVENVYNQLTALNVGADKALVSAVVSFSNHLNFVTPEPLSSSEDVVKAVRAIRSEESGDEFVFEAVIRATDKWIKQRTQFHRNVMLVVVTDEAGSDAQNLEKAIALTKRHGIRCYVVGDEAPFGRKSTEMPFTLENGETVIGVMDNGPENYYPDLVSLAYWGANGWDLDQMSSGFGPYALTRLSTETGGLFLVAQESGRHKFDPQIMRNYSPDYRPIAAIDSDLRKNQAKQSLVKVAVESGINQLAIPRLDFPAENDTVLRQAITESQKPQAELDYKLTALQSELEQGEKDRKKVGEARWQAAYDLAMGRVLALRVRSYGYNLMLAEMKVNPKKFEKPGSNRWRLAPSAEINSGQAVKKMAAKANEYLNRVIDGHPGTPWALMADREKGTPFGWEWKEESYVPPSQAQQKANEQKKAPRFVDEVDPKSGKKTRRQLPDQPVRRNI
ncbi:MAG: vWA domain-containing protein [Planctomycetaceae bacterium]